MMVLEARNIVFGYSDRVVLNGVSVQVEAGKVVSLLGPNGTGKSTLLKILLGIKRPAKGEVLLDGTPLARIAPREYARNVAYVPQLHNATFPYTVLDVVLMGRMPHTGFFSGYSKKDRRLAEEALERLSLGHLKTRPYSEISGGERQLVLIARALAQEARIFILDEPVGGLDYGNQLRLLERIRSLAREGYAFIQSTHFPEHALLVSDSVLLLNSGRIVAEGNPVDVITPENIYRLYGVEVDMVRLGGSYSACVPRFCADRTREHRFALRK
ncbi:ABC transporter ATP-binding protein [Methylocaldum szegediense]|nr:ABC transporter ATP-binding protein [Methylocaldum szegediense]